MTIIITAVPVDDVTIMIGVLNYGYRVTILWLKIDLTSCPEIEEGG